MATDPAAAGMTVDADGPRPDGRMAAECRPTFLRTSAVTSGATGSAYGEFARTRVVVSVFGPRPRDRGAGGSNSDDPHGMDLDCHVHLPFEAEEEPTSTTSAGPDRAEKEVLLAAKLRQSLLPSIDQDKLAKTCVEVQCTILESDGSDVGPAVMCASFALATSGIPLYGLVTYCTVGLHDGRVLLDPTGGELEACDAEVSVAYLGSRDQVSFLDASGDWSGRSMTECVDTCVEGCRKMQVLVRGALLNSRKES